MPQDPYAEFGGQAQSPPPADPYAAFGGQAIKQPPPEGIVNRFLAGAQAGMGGENALNTSVDPKHPISTNPMVPGSGVYRDIKSGNYAGAAGRVAGPVAALLPMLLGRGGAEATPQISAPAEGEYLPPQAAPRPSVKLADAQVVQPKMLPAEATPAQSLPYRRTLGQVSPDDISVPPETRFTAGKIPQRSGLALPEGSPASPGSTEATQVPIGKFAKETNNPNPYSFSGAPKSMNIVQSTNVGKVGYNPDAKVMTVEYKNGFVYSYHGVPQEIYQGALDSESAGSYISRNVKGRYETVRRGSVMVKKSR